MEYDGRRIMRRSTKRAYDESADEEIIEFEEFEEVEE